MLTIAQLVKKRRMELNLTQKELAKLLGYRVPQFVSNLERGTCDIPKNKLKRLCRVLMLDQSTVYNILLAEKAREIAKSIGFSA